MRNWKQVRTQWRSDLALRTCRYRVQSNGSANESQKERETPGSLTGSGYSANRT